MTRIINLNKVDPEQVIVEYGDLRLDITRISALHALRLMQYREKHLEDGNSSPAEALEIVLDAIRDTNPGVTEEQLLGAAPFHALIELIATVAGEIMRTTGETTPLEKIPETSP